VVVDFYPVFKERFGVKVGFGANLLPGIVSLRPLRLGFLARKFLGM
jgi:hypothetical protein